ncbi:hypothetical protein VQH23_01100 [Pararoseomonas sp. SCSIO 73927]|uniref:hypothetical protein n=1 Tax=Pararoseomonas sp. SCSIO 73927 TaxID=3114537 RepID=UPI0030D58DD7
MSGVLWTRAETACAGADEVTERRPGPQDEAARQLISEAVRAVLEEGLRHAPDPVLYLRRAASEVLLVLNAFDAAGPRDGAELRAIVAEEVVLVSRTMLRQRRS